MKKILTASLLLSGLMALGTSELTIEKPYFRWLWGGFGFQNSEANLTALMPDDFLNERVLKTFAELSPTFARGILPVIAVPSPEAAVPLAQALVDGGILPQTRD